MNNHPAPNSSGPVVGGFKLPRGVPNLTATRVIAILQILIGIIMLSIGAKVVDSVEDYWVRSTGAGVWIGVWVCVTGFVGLASFRNPPNESVMGIYLAMNIFTTVADFVAGSFFLAATVFYAMEGDSYYNVRCNTVRCFTLNYGEEQNLYGALLGFSIIEWFVALVAAILRCNNGCCGGPQHGAVLQLQPTMINVARPDWPGTGYMSDGMAAQMPPPMSYGNPPQQAIAAPQSTLIAGNTASNYHHGTVSLSPSLPSAPPSYLSHPNKSDASSGSFYPQSPPWSMNMSPATSPASSASGYHPSQSLSNSTHDPHTSYAPQAPVWSAPNMAFHSDAMVPPPYSEK